MPANEITYTAHVDAPREKLWGVLADFGNVAKVSPGVAASRLTSSAPVGVGTTRHCDLALFGASLEERIVEFEEGQLLAIDIYETKRLPFVKDQLATFKLADDGDGSRLTATISYSIGAGPFGKMMHAMMLRSQLDSGWRQFVAGIKLHTETGKFIDAKTKVPEQAAELVSA